MVLEVKVYAVVDSELAVAVQPKQLLQSHQWQSFLKEGEAVVVLFLHCRLYSADSNQVLKGEAEAALATSFQLPQQL